MALFKSFNIPAWLLDKLQSNGYVKTTGIQELVIPQALKGKSLVVRSETGSGKTHCFLVPMISNIDENLNELQGLILAPTKELANQIHNFLSQLTDNTNIRIKLVSSTQNEEKSVKNVKSKPHIIVGTIGKLHDLFIDDSFISIPIIFLKLFFSHNPIVPVPQYKSIRLFDFPAYSDALLYIFVIPSLFT